MGLVRQASASNGARAEGFEIKGNRVVGVDRNDFARRMLVLRRRGRDELRVLAAEPDVIFSAIAKTALE